MAKVGNAIEKLKASDAWKSLAIVPTYTSMIINTPIIRSDELARASGLAEVYIKAEYLQLGNSFKVRGALLKLSSLLKRPDRPAVFTASAGNHGLGLALAARELGFDAEVYVPVDTPEVKKKKIIDAGATLHVIGKDFDDCESISKSRCLASSGVYVSSFDDEYVIAGNGGMLAQEIDRELGGSILGMDLIVPVGGGGLAGGVASYFYGSSVRIIGVEPERSCALTDSLSFGSYIENYIGDKSCADGLAGAISQRTYELCKKGLSNTVTVSEDEIMQAISWAYEHLGIVIEGSAAVSVAVLLNRKTRLSPKVCLVLTGSNIDHQVIKRARNEHSNK